MLTARLGRRTGAGSAPARSVGGGSASGVPSMVGIIPPLLQLRHCSGTAPGLVAWLPPYLWSWNSNGTNVTTPRTVTCRTIQGASVLGIVRPPGKSMLLLMLGSLCVPLCQLLLSQALFSKSMPLGEGELLCGAALPSSHGRVGGPGVGTGGWGQPKACTGDTSAEDLYMVNIPFPSSSCRLGFGQDLAWPPETVTVTQMPSCFSGNLRNAPWDSERVPSPWRSRVMLGSASCLFELCD